MQDAEFTGVTRSTTASGTISPWRARQDGALQLFIDGGFQGEPRGAKHGRPHHHESASPGKRAFLDLQGMNFRFEDSSFVGDIDEFCIFGRALSVPEIQKLAGVGQ